MAPGSASGDLVVIDPGAFAGLTAVGRGAVLTHELTHVATRAVVGTSPPVWVDEGFADYVAYLGTPLTTRDLAADVLASPQRVAALTDLPPDSAFDPAAGDVGAAYAEAWLAMRFVEREGGPAMVVDFYRAAAGMNRPGDLAGPCAAAARARTADAAGAGLLRRGRVPRTVVRAALGRVREGPGLRAVTQVRAAGSPAGPAGRSRRRTGRRASGRPPPGSLMIGVSDGITMASGLNVASSPRQSPEML